jgi:hypothetical protein
MMNEKRGLECCQICGQEARVHVTSEQTGQATVRHLCISCAAARSDIEQERYSAINHGFVMICIGVFITLMSVFADSLRFGKSAGFGELQWTGLVLAIVLLLSGLVLRTLTVLMTGAVLGGITLLADWLSFGNSPGFGGQQVLGVILGSAMILFGLYLALRRQKPLPADT